MQHLRGHSDISKTMNSQHIDMSRKLIPDDARIPSHAFFDLAGEDSADEGFTSYRYVPVIVSVLGD